MSSGGTWVFEFINGNLVTYPVGQPNSPTWTTQPQTRGQGTLFNYTANGDLLVQNETGNVLWRFNAPQNAHNHTGIDDAGRFAHWDGQGRFVSQINLRNIIIISMKLFILSLRKRKY